MSRGAVERPASLGGRAVREADGTRREAFGRDVRQALARSPKELPSKYFYDPLGSQLFEAICALPWYPITRAERALLEAQGQRILDAFGGSPALVDLGCGSGDKVARLAWLARPQGGGSGLVHLVDISPAAIQASEATLRSVDHVTIVAHHGTYEEGLRHIAAIRGADPTSMLVLFLGSNIGNLHPPEAEAFLGMIHQTLRPEDGLLLGADLVKAERDLSLAYDDPLGVTAAFNKNLLHRLNAELGGEFDLDSFQHRAVWNEAESRVEMHLVSARSQAVRIAGAECTVRLAQGEWIRTECSYKYHPADVVTLGGEAGFRADAQWVEPDARFSLTLFRRS